MDKENIIYHTILGCKKQLSIGDIIRSPFNNDRDYTTWPKYKQCSENLLENYRLKHLSNYPSRNNCFFVSEDLESAQEWGKYKCRTAYYDNFYVYSLEILNGCVKYFDTDWFEQLAAVLSKGEIRCLNEYGIKDSIIGFWSGKCMRSNDSLLKDGLFRGEAKVIKIEHYEYNPHKRILKITE